MSEKDKADGSLPDDAASAAAAADGEEMTETVDESAEASPEARIAELEKQLAQAQDKFLRTRADFDNYRKRMHREISDTRTAARAGAIEDILPVLDHFQMAMAHANEQTDYETLKQGMDMILTEFRRVFESMGVETIATVGETFDPNLHEAISLQASDEVEEGVILHEWKSGYRLGDRVLRAPSVVVSSGPAEHDSETND